MTLNIHILFAAFLSVFLPCVAAAGVTGSGLSGASLSSRALIEEAVLMEEGLDIPPDGEFVLRLPEGLPEEAYRLEDFRMDHKSGMFSTRMIFEDGDIGFRGQAIVVVPASVPVRRISPGEIISGSDLVQTRIPFKSVSSMALREKDRIVGMEVRRMLLPDRPVPQRSVVAPRVVRRGDSVTITFSNGGIDLTAPGRALEDGAKGANIRVVNENSNKTIQAIASGKGVVSVQ